MSLAALVRCVAVVSMASGMTGCVQMETIGRVTLFSYSLWFQLLCPICTVVVLVLGLNLRRSKNLMALLLGWSLVTVSVVVGVSGSASVASASILLSATGYSDKRSPWREREDVKFNDLTGIRVEHRRSSDRNQRNYFLLELQNTDGTFSGSSMSHLMEHAALARILEAARAAGVKVAARNGDVIGWRASDA